MRRVDGDGREQRIDLALIKCGGILLLPSVIASCMQHANPSRVQSGQQLLVPAAVLALDKRAHLRGVARRGSAPASPVRADLVVAVFNTLQEAGDADFDKFVEIAGGDGQKLHALEQRILGSSASSSTRRLKRSQDSSRLKKSCSRFGCRAGIRAEFIAGRPSI